MSSDLILNGDRFAFVYLVFGEKIHLIDSGVAGAESIIWEYIEKQGCEPDEIFTLILTHSHPDHIGSAKSIKDRTKLFEREKSLFTGDLLTFPGDLPWEIKY